MLKKCLDVAPHAAHLAAAEAVASHAGVSARDLKVDTTPRPELGDLAVGCFAIAKATNQNPAQVAQAIAAAFQPNEWLAKATAAGPFVNFHANRARAFRWLADATREQSILAQVGSGSHLHRLRLAEHLQAPRVSPHPRHDDRPRARAHVSRARQPRVGINFLGDGQPRMVLAAYEQWGDAARRVELLDELYKRIRAERPDAEDLRPRVLEAPRGRRARARPRCGSVFARCRGPSSRTSTRAIRRWFPPLLGSTVF